MIAKKTVIQDIKLADFPEEIDEQNNIKVYGETSWENQLAVLSHYLHNNDCILPKGIFRYKFSTSIISSLVHRLFVAIDLCYKLFLIPIKTYYHDTFPMLWHIGLSVHDKVVE